MTRVPITKHGRDHRPDGSDPIPGAGQGCSPYASWDSTLQLVAFPVTGDVDITDPSADFDGSVWACGTTDPLAALSMVTGNANIIITDGGSISLGDASTPFPYHYGFAPPWIGDLNKPAAGVPFGDGVTIQEGTRTVIPAWLVYNPTRGLVTIMVQGVELGQGRPDGTSADGWNMARPDWPFEYADGDTLFAGTFMYFSPGTET